MAEQKTVATTGNLVVAEAMRQCKPDVVAAYPITPQTTIVEEFAKFVAQGRVHTEYVMRRVRALGDERVRSAPRLPVLAS